MATAWPAVLLVPRPPRSNSDGTSLTGRPSSTPFPPTSAKKVGAKVDRHAPVTLDHGAVLTRARRV
jgi:hypothetical protein